MFTNSSNRYHHFYYETFIFEHMNVSINKFLYYDLSKTSKKFEKQIIV